MLTRCLERVARCRQHDPQAFVPWSIGDFEVGRVHRDRVDSLLAIPSPFSRVGDRIVLNAEPNLAARSAALAAWVQRAAAAGAIRRPTGELYAVGRHPWSSPLASVDRAALPGLGVAAQGVHLNGYVRDGAELALWIARRSRDKSTFPGHLDNIVAGGQAFGAVPQETLRRECQEEAGLPAALAEQATAVGAISYLQQDGLGSKADTLWLFDLELPHEFVPRPTDGEVEGFELWPCTRVIGSLAGDGMWKPNCALVALDFLLRHGALDAVLTPDQRWQLWRALRGGCG